jgi:hypothetical protein
MNKAQGYSAHSMNDGVDANGEQVSVELILCPEVRTEQQETRQNSTENDFSKIPTEVW